MIPLTKKYQVWELNDPSNYTLKEFDTLEECIAAPKYSAWYITKRVSMAITDREEPLPILGMGGGSVITRSIESSSTIPTTVVTTDEERTAIADLYDSGRIGNIG